MQPYCKHNLIRKPPSLSQMLADDRMGAAEMLLLDYTGGLFRRFCLLDNSDKTFRHRLLHCAFSCVVQQTGTVRQLGVYLRRCDLGYFFSTTGDREAVKHKPFSIPDAMACSIIARIEDRHDFHRQSNIANLVYRKLIERLLGRESSAGPAA